MRPPDENLSEQCNFGYGRHICPLFPANAAGDAIRFTTVNGRIVYVVERDCTPVESGIIDLTESSGQETPLLRQARTFASNSPFMAERP